MTYRLIFAVCAIVSFFPSIAHAVPSFARQTGLQCNACHTAYPKLNAFGRQFKLNSYSLDGGDSKLPPLAFMAQPSFTHTDKSQAAAAAPHFSDNDNPALTQASIFYGGKIYDRLGAFSQFTYDGVGRRFAIDNTDIRWSGTGEVGGSDLVYGLTLNNNPTVEDLWNTTPAWGFPYAGSGVAPTPTASTLLEGGLAGQVAGLGAYAEWNDMVYAQIAGYRTLGRSTQTALGVSPEGEDQLSDTMPYWRLEAHHSWGNHYLSVGTLGLLAKTYPGRDRSAGSDRRLDLGLDAQYEFSEGPHDLSLMVRSINERANWDAGLSLGNNDYAKTTLRTLSASASYLYDQTYGIDLNFTSITGTADATLYGTNNGKPNSNQYVVQLNYLPFNRDGGPDFWPWFNPKFVLQYTGYTKFDGAGSNYDGSGRNASDNNTLYLLAWLPF